MTPEFIAAFAFGCIFITALLVIAVVIPEPTIQQMLFFRVVLALAAAGVGAVIPGFFTIQGEVVKITLQAGGALALFVLIYLINPPNIVPKPTLPRPRHPVRRAVPRHLIEEGPIDPVEDGGSSK